MTRTLIVIAFFATLYGAHSMGQRARVPVSDWEREYFYELERRHDCDATLSRAVSNCRAECFTTPRETGSLLPLTSSQK